MTIVDTSRISIGATRDVHDVGYTPDGTAYCLREDQHHWQYGDEHWANRSRHGYITFYDRHLGMAVEHKVAVAPGESYVDFWSRIRRAENLGRIEVMGTSAYSSKDREILAREIPDLSVKKLVMEEQTPGLTEAEAKAWLAQNKQDTKEPGITRNGKIGGAGLICIAVIVALGYLILGGKRK